uniref:DUF5710 domain-containing protein n=1 Tax=Bacillus sp. DX2.2 TaxID=3073452 RepID=UPI00402AFAA3
MPRINLCVPYDQKDKVKALGGKWDVENKTWYIIVNTYKETEPFSEWIYTAKSPEFWIVELHRECWRCRKQTPIFAYCFPKGYISLEFENEDDEACSFFWEPVHFFTLLTYVYCISRNALQIMKKITNNYYLDSTKMGGEYYLNHCKYCNAKLGDFSSFEDNPLHTIEDNEDIKTHKFSEAIEISGSYSWYM